MSEQRVVQALLNVLLLVMLTAPHEFAHAWVATRLGDDTPRLQGRLTLNPIAHIDWLGTLILPFVTSLLSGGFLGWGKPVIAQPSKLRWGWNGLALVAMAGPASNVVMAVILAIVALATARASPGVSEFAGFGVQLSLYLGLFNLLPIPPLDGSKLLLAARIPVAVYGEIARFGFMLLIVLMTATSLGLWLDNLSLQGAQAIFGMLH
jgi:Zn-dependent protease